MTISRKCSPYIIGGTNAPLTNGDRKPAFVMMVDCSPTYYAQMRALMGPDVLIEMRWTEPGDYQPVDNPEQRADEWWAKRQAAIMAVPAGDLTVFAGYNEKPKSEAAAFCRFELRRVAHLHNSGRHAAVGSWGVGCPDLDEWPTYTALRMAMRKRTDGRIGDVWDLHEYASDYADIDNRWHIGRFTLPAVAANLGDWPVVVSEYGYDIVEGRGQAGWQLQPGANDETCLAMLRKGGEFYDTQPRVVGYGAYQQGSTDPRFYPFNMYGVWPGVVGEYGAPVVSPIPPPIPPPPTTTIPYFHSSRNGYQITDIVLHDTEGSAEAAERWFRDPANTGRSSAHVIVDDQGVVMRLIPDEWSAHHAGYATIPGNVGINPNRFTLGLELEYPAAPASPAWPEAQLEAAADVVREWCDRWQITAEHIWEHKTIDPTRRSDPRNWDRAAFLRRVFPPVQEPYLPTNDPFMQARKTPQERYEGVRWWLEERKRQHEAGKEEYADQIDVALIEQMYKWEQE